VLIPTFLKFSSVRDASVEAAKKFSEFGVEKESREDLYKAVVAFRSNNPAVVAKLSPEDKRLLDKTIEGYERNGLALSIEKRARMKEIKKRTNIFRSN
jgi:thimet oligopeptidase